MTWTWTGAQRWRRGRGDVGDVDVDLGTTGSMNNKNFCVCTPPPKYSMRVEMREFSRVCILSISMYVYIINHTAGRWAAAAATVFLRRRRRARSRAR